MVGRAADDLQRSEGALAPCNFLRLLGKYAICHRDSVGSLQDY